MCVQRFDDSRNSAIHITYRISLRSSSMREPRDPLLKVLNILVTAEADFKMTRYNIKIVVCVCAERACAHPKNSSKINSTVCRRTGAPGRAVKRRPQNTGQFIFL